MLTIRFVAGILLFEAFLPPRQLRSCPRFAPVAFRIQTGGDDPSLAELMIEDDEAGIETEMAIGQFEVVDRTTREAWLDEAFEIISPVAEAAAEREWHLHLVEQFEARQQRR